MLLETLLPWMLGALFGSMLFFAVTVAPTVFQALDADQGSAFLRRFFPKYYLWGIVLASLSLLLAGFVNGLHWTTASCGIVLVLFLYARQVLMPRINQARDQDRSGDAIAAKRFKKLHLQSVIINGLQLLILLGLTLTLGLSG